MHPIVGAFFWSSRFTIWQFLSRLLSMFECMNIGSLVFYFCFLVKSVSSTNYDYDDDDDDDADDIQFFLFPFLNFLLLFWMAGKVECFGYLFWLKRMVWFGPTVTDYMCIVENVLLLLLLSLVPLMTILWSLVLILRDMCRTWILVWLGPSLININF